MIRITNRNSLFVFMGILWVVMVALLLRDARDFAFGAAALGAYGLTLFAVSRIPAVKRPEYPLLAAGAVLSIIYGLCWGRKAAELSVYVFLAVLCFVIAYGGSKRELDSK